MAEILQQEKASFNHNKTGESDSYVGEKVLQPDEQVEIDLETSLADSQEAVEKLGTRGRVVAAVQASNKEFLVLDMRETNANKDFFIIDESFSAEERKGFKGIFPGVPVVIGRGHHTDRFSYPSAISRDHFEVIASDDELRIRNLRPRNKTIVKAHFPSDVAGQDRARPLVESGRTRDAEDRVREYPNYGERDPSAPYGYYMNLPILGSKSESVDGGVYLGGSAREAIVVDGKSDILKQTYEEVASELSSSFHDAETLPVEAALLSVMHKVQEVMPYDERKAMFISMTHGEDALVGVSTYIEEGAGVCRHQGLLASYIVEQLIKDGHLAGSVGIERNTVREYGGSHAWSVYKEANSNKENVIVIDPAQSFVGTKARAQREGRWEYRLS